MLVLPADHVIKDRAAFQKTLTTAAARGRGDRRAGDDRNQANVGMSRVWLHRAGRASSLAHRLRGETAIHHVVRFREKPNADLAESFLRKGNFRWNAGMFVWSVPTVLSEFNRQSPELANFISQIRAREISKKACGSVSANCRKFPSTTRSWNSADRVLVVEARFRLGRCRKLDERSQIISRAMSKTTRAIVRSRR